LGQLETGASGQHPVEQDEVRVLVGQELARFVRMGGLDDAILGVFERKTHDLANIRFIVDDKNGGHGVLNRVRSGL
jgi:hypothetical protein